jgi:SAM-dependent methyltransferase
VTGRPGWLLDEVASAGRENLDAAHVARYDAKEDAGAAAEVELLRRWGLHAEAVVVDLGAGTGQFALAVARECRRVVAVDVSPVMLRSLRAAARGLATLDVVEAGFLTYAHEGRPADIVYSRYALHHLPDFWKGVALSRIHSMLRPGGVLRLCDVIYRFDPPVAEERIEAWCATGGDAAEQGWSRAELEEHVRDEHSTYTWLFEALLERSGFAIEDADHSDDGVVARYIARAI